MGTGPAPERLRTRPQPPRKVGSWPRDISPAAPHVQVSNWMEQEGSQYLQVLTPKDGSLETVEKNHAMFEDFFLQAAVGS